MAKKAKKYTSEQQETTLQADGRSYKLCLNDIAHTALIFNGDCIDVMSSEIADSSIDCILTDPPYNLGNYMHERKTNMVKMRRNSFAYAGWDNMDYQEWATQMRNFFDQCYRVLKKRGTMIVFMSIIKVESIVKIAQEAGFYYKTTGIWHKTNPMPRNMKIQFVTSNECWMYFVKNATTGTFNGNNKVKHDFIESSVCPNSEKKYGKHPTQKPLKIIKELLECVTNPGDIVLDPFVGSGTTCVASALLNRKSIGIDLDEAYCEISKLRLNNLEDIV